MLKAALVVFSFCTLEKHSYWQVPLTPSQDSLAFLLSGQNDDIDVQSCIDDRQSSPATLLQY